MTYVVLIKDYLDQDDEADTLEEEHCHNLHFDQARDAELNKP